MTQHRGELPPQSDANEGQEQSARSWWIFDGVVLFNFGDSNSDTSSVAAVMGIHIAPPEGRASFQRPMGWLSDDNVILNLI